MTPFQGFWPADQQFVPEEVDSDDDGFLSKEAGIPAVSTTAIPDSEDVGRSIDKRFTFVSPSVDGVGQVYDLTVDSPTLLRFDTVDTDTSVPRWDMIAEAWPVASPDRFNATIRSQRDYLYLPDAGNWRIRFTLTASAVFNKVTVGIVQERDFDVARLAGLNRGGPSELLSGTDAVGIGASLTLVALPRLRRARLQVTVGSASYRIGTGPAISLGAVNTVTDIDFDLFPMATLAILGGAAGGTVLWYATLD